MGVWSSKLTGCQPKFRLCCINLCCITSKGPSAEHHKINVRRVPRNAWCLPMCSGL